jgi:2-polyprenyl-3-methyl-5-hydroxy-6-metoxy-1,4-benzoquinol methylase
MTAATSLYAEPRAIDDASACYFYHTMEIPDHGLVRGEWDLRGRERTYLGGVDFPRKSVLEIGTASGFLCYWMEEQGAQVTGLDLDKDCAWDLVSYHGADQAARRRERYDTIDRLNNSWWFTHARRKSRARCIYRSIYRLGPEIGSYDVVTLCSVLLHLRDPVRAIELACARARSEVIVTDVSEHQFLSAKPHLQNELCLQFLPRAEQGAPVDAWFFMPAPLVAEVLRIFGFGSIEVTRHTQRFKDGHDWQFYTVVGRRERQRDA